MAADQLTGFSLLLASSAGLLAGGFAGPLNFPLPDFAAATGFAVLGAICRAGFDAKDRRERARASGVVAPTFDFIALAYALTGAPLVGGIALAGVRGLSFVPDYMAGPAIMLLGYAGKDGVDLMMRIVAHLIGKKSGIE